VSDPEALELRQALMNMLASDVDHSLRQDVALLRADPWIKKTTKIVGLKYDDFTGVLTEVVSQ